MERAGVPNVLYTVLLLFRHNVRVYHFDRAGHGIRVKPSNGYVMLSLC
jgi:hypothetical protein